jgi:hypothetical protein
MESHGTVAAYLLAPLLRGGTRKRKPKRDARARLGLVREPPPLARRDRSDETGATATAQYADA